MNEFAYYTTQDESEKVEIKWCVYCQAHTWCKQTGGMTSADWICTQCNQKI